LASPDGQPSSPIFVRLGGVTYDASMKFSLTNHTRKALTLARFAK
jgi:hypothetical protein